MKKSKQDIKRIADYIYEKEKTFVFNQTEICRIFNVGKDASREICKHLEPVTQGNIKKYFIIDVLEYLYSEKN